MYALAAATTTLLLATTALAANHEVAVGPGRIFTPDSISNVAEGDTVSVKFGSGHDIAQSTFAAPCQYMPNGIYSGPSPQDGDVFTFEVRNASAPMWFYCTVGNHCQAGMALAINPTTERTIDGYKQAAAQAQTTAPQTENAVGGSIGDAASSSGSPSSSGSASATNSQSSASSTASGSSAAGQARVAVGVLAGAVAGVAAFAL